MSKKVIDQSLIKRRTVVLLVLSAAMCVAIIVVGVRFLVVPEAGATDYGLAVTARGEAGPYLAIKGLRDLSFGVIGLTLLAVRQFEAVGWVMIAVSVVPFGDAVIVLAYEGAPALAYGMHGGTGAALLLVGALLVCDQRSFPAPQRGRTGKRNFEQEA